jgi:deazaflavin-dependent oxidoreductase (nitroreductase family)
MNTLKTGLGEGGVIDITTIGARTGAKRRIEINYVQLDGRFYITGRPGRKRDWQANLKTNPDFTVHVKDQSPVDVGATAKLITDSDERSDVLYRILTEAWDNHPDKAAHILPNWVSESPLIEFTLA